MSPQGEILIREKPFLLADMNPNISNRTSSAAEILVSSDDLLTEIFLRLPVKSFIRFQSVSKRWKSLISDPQFRLTRSSILDPVSGVIIQRDRRTYVVPFDSSSLRELKLTDDESAWGHLMILSYCKGLLLCSILSDYYIWNPTTNQYSKLPELLEKESRMSYAMILAFDPSKSPHYKVVCVRRLRDECKILEVYSSETGSWKRIDKPVKEAIDNFRYGVYWNGAIHWMASTKDKKSIYFNPDEYDDQRVTEVMPTVSVMDHASSMCCRCFGESGGHLYYFHDPLLRFNGVYEFNVYEMRRDYSEWFVKYKVKTINFRMNTVVSSHTLVWGDKDEDSFFVLSIGNMFVRFNFVHGTLETLYEFDGNRWNHDTLQLQYIESIHSV